MALQGYYRRMAIRGFRGSDGTTAGRLQIRLQAVKLWPGIWWGGGEGELKKESVSNPSEGPF
jgi:hypothetical protein